MTFKLAAQWLTNTFLKGGKTEALSTPGLLKRKEKRRLYLAIQTVEGLQTTVKTFTSLMQELLLEYPGFYTLGGRLSQPTSTSTYGYGQVVLIFLLLNYCYSIVLLDFSWI
uniref:Uncharacterized protein n=1 Tax=Clytia hemisphaerica TaxID=252671 RepID=A0A7M5TX64_9CNID